ncbi:ribonuclease HI family protein [Furfurilactobacillus siliginis]|uniref:Ribonuclease HI n=1 Tax=Furfurilactobacillus siliginis TaxID=348151 RepID=A0A0R2L6J3_9LACO|nr:ribonuclease HI family protein [Furfurilactobacillus siliginis]KRN96960.1 hypothetical protein IV55_GL000835 [Furfurilactobacillus siliginis]GEK27719.1 ribonuclease HI [Furfurilactobacillus siliginis]
MIIKLYVDAASNAQHPTADSQSGAGILIIENGTQHQMKQIVPAPDNHQAEFLAAIAGFSAVAKMTNTDTTVMFFTDSRLVADAVGKGSMKHYPELTTELLALQDHFQLVITQWIPERDNHGAHQLALQALHSIN